jgi:hypothetical protein
MADKTLLAFLDSSSGIPYEHAAVSGFGHGQMNLSHLHPHTLLGITRTQHERVLASILNRGSRRRSWITTVHPKTLPPMARSNLTLPAFAKPLEGFGGKNITIIRTPAELLAVPPTYLAQQGVWIQQLRLMAENSTTVCLSFSQATDSLRSTA